MLKKVLNGKSAQKSGFKSTQKSAQRTILLKKVLLKWLKKSKFTQKSKFAQKSSSKKFILRKSYAEKWQILKKGNHSKKYFCQKKHDFAFWLKEKYFVRCIILILIRIKIICQILQKLLICHLLRSRLTTHLTARTARITAPTPDGPSNGQSNDMEWENTW